MNNTSPTLIIGWKIKHSHHDNNNNPSHSRLWSSHPGEQKALISNRYQRNQNDPNCDIQNKVHNFLIISLYYSPELDYKSHVLQKKK